MNNLVSYGKKVQDLCSKTCSFCGKKLRGFCSIAYLLMHCCYRDLIFRVTPIVLEFFYFLFMSVLGFGILKSLKFRASFTPRNLDLFFMTVSSTTVSSMSTIEMEVFSNSQLVLITFLIFIGGEVFTSMVGLHLKRSKTIRTWKSEGRVTSVESDPNSPPPIDNFDDQIELEIVTVPESGYVPRVESQTNVWSSYKPFIKYDSIKFLGFVVLGYLLSIQIFGIASVLLYLAISLSARDVLRNKGLKTFTFSMFTVVSTFASCGFVPTNENMVVFRKNSGLLWILIPQLLLGNTLFPPFLRFFIWVVGKKFKREEAKYLLKNTKEIEYFHLLPQLHSLFLVGTVIGFILMGFALFCAMEWNSEGLSELNTYQKVVGVVFQVTNARHSGETIVDLSIIAPAILVFFVVMMYLPPYTSFLPVKKDRESSLDSEYGIRKKRRIGENFICSQLSYLVVFIILICITERKNIKEDPINFSVLNIITEVISAYGNVGFSTGYSCSRRLKSDPSCVDKSYGFSGKWSDGGKFILIIVMFFGRLKKFNMNGGQAWKLL